MDGLLFYPHYTIYPEEMKNDQDNDRDGDDNIRQSHGIL